jgi:predicted DNA-binding transcriptional regulator YafY
MRLDRLLSITIMLINRRKVTAPDLAEHFGVSIRTIYRDIEAILEAGIPVTSCPGYEGGFGIMENYRINRQVLTFEDMLSILGTLKGINATLRNRNLDGAIEKIECLIPEDKEEEFERRREQIAMDIVPWGGGERQQEYFPILHKSITEQKTVSFTYTTCQSATTRRIVEPMTLLFKSYSWYLFGYCRARKDFRLFKLSRIRDLRPLGERFIRRNKSYRDVLTVKDSPPTKPPIRLELLFIPQARVKVEEFFEPGRIKIQHNGSLSVAIDVSDQDWIYPWLLGFADEVEVKSPEHIRNRFIERLNKIQKKYET